MADVADRADEVITEAMNRATHAARLAVANMPAGTPGVCKTCGWDSPRLVDGLCAPCRDTAQHLKCNKKGAL